MSVPSDIAAHDIIGKLAEKGEEGEYLIVSSLNQVSASAFDVTSTTWDYIGSFINTDVVWSMFRIAGMEKVYVRHLANMYQDSVGETVETRIYNNTNGEAVTGTLLSKTGTGGEHFDSGWNQYTPPTDETPIRLISQGKVSASTGHIRWVSLWFGLKL